MPGGSSRPAPTTLSCAPEVSTPACGASSSSRKRSPVPDPFYDPESEERLGRAFDRRLVRRLTEAARPHRRLIAGSMLLFPLVALAELAQPWLLKVAIDDHILKSDWVGLTWVAGLYIGILVILYALRTLEGYLMQLTAQPVIHELREAMFHHLP